MVKLSILDKVERTCRIFDETLSDKQRVVLAYSGGKDSTVVALLFYEWVKRREEDLNVIIIHNDTLGEIPLMEFWARSFMKFYVKKLDEIGVNAKYELLMPKASETFYWRTIIRGYPAPNFKFRWCIWLLKRNPTRRYLRAQRSEIALLLGVRDDASSFRSASLKKRSFSCPLARVGCTARYLLESADVQSKVAPIRDWSVDEVWSYLYHHREEFRLNQLFILYAVADSLNVRYGCWHCTLVNKQLPHYFLGEEYLMLEAARIFYRLISDITDLRIPKNKGYSRLGPLNLTGRGLILYVTRLAEKMSGIKLYGLDEAKLDGYTLRQIFYEMDEAEAQEIIRRVERDGERRKRLVPDIGELRSLSLNSEEVKLALNKLARVVNRWKDTIMRDKLEEFLISLENELH